MRVSILALIPAATLALAAHAVAQTPAAPPAGGGHQHGAPSAAPATPGAPARPEAPGGGHGGMMPCPMMSGMGHGAMMGGGTPPDPRTLQMHGEMMKAMGEIMLKYGKAMESTPK